MGCGGSKAIACEAPDVIPAVEGSVADRTVASVEVGACKREALEEVFIDDSDESTASDSKRSTPSAGSTCTALSSRELPADGQESESPADVAATAIAEAAVLMRKHLALEAEEVLGRALARLGEASIGDAAAATAADDLRASETYAAVYKRCQQYDEIAGLLGTADRHQKLMWEGEGSQLWVHAPAGETWLEFKVICDIDAPLSHCLACSNELDLIPEREPNVLGEPSFLGDSNPWLSVTRFVIGVLLLRVELINEVYRFYNTERGFMAESIRSDFAEEGRPVPPKHWRNMRVKARVSNLLIPKGGGCNGTTMVQSSRIEAGFKIPDRIVAFVFGQLAPSMMRNLRKNAKAVGSPDGPYAPRLAEDRMGIYAECAKVEEAAARRQTTGADSLPGQDWLSRPWRLTAPPTP